MRHDRELYVRYVKLDGPEGLEGSEENLPLYPGETVLNTFFKDGHLGMLIVYTEMRRYSHDTSRQRSRV